MTDFHAPPEERPLSGTAVASLVFGLLLCIPGAGIPGAAFGAIGFASTGATGTRRGRGLAVAGLVLSVIAIAGWAIAAVSMKKLYDTAIAPTMEVIFAGPDRTLEAAFDDDQTSFEADWMPAHAPTDAERKAFVAGVTLAMGAFQSASLDENGGPPPSNSMGPGGEAFEIPYLLEFENGSVSSVIRFQPSLQGEVTPSGSYVGIDRIEVKVPDGGVFVLEASKKGDASIGGVPVPEFFETPAADADTDSGSGVGSGSGSGAGESDTP